MMVKCIVEKSEIKKFEVLFGKFLLVLNRVRNLRNEAGFGENRSLLYIETTMHRLFLNIHLFGMLSFKPLILGFSVGCWLRFD